MEYDFSSVAEVIVSRLKDRYDDQINFDIKLRKLIRDSTRNIKEMDTMIETLERIGYSCRVEHEYPGGLTFYKE